MEARLENEDTKNVTVVSILPAPLLKVFRKPKYNTALRYLCLQIHGLCHDS